MSFLLLIDCQNILHRGIGLKIVGGRKDKSTTVGAQNSCHLSAFCPNLLRRSMGKESQDIKSTVEGQGLSVLLFQAFGIHVRRTSLERSKNGHARLNEIGNNRLNAAAEVEENLYLEVLLDLSIEIQIVPS